MEDREQRTARGLALLEERARSMPAAIRAAAAAPLPDLCAARAARICLTTGLGSSAAHARFLAAALQQGGMPARFLPLGSLVQGAGLARADSLLVVFSQGWSPNARAAFADVERFAATVLVTAVSAQESPPEKVRAIAELTRRGVAVLSIPGAEEYQTLLRLVGPMAGYVAALRLARAIAPQGESLAFDAESIAAAVAAAPERISRELSELRPAIFDGPIAFVAQGLYAECVDNLRYKVLEGMLRPAPPVWELLEIAHGPLQQAHTGEAHYLALSRGCSALEQDLLERLERCLDPTRHRLWRLAAAAEGLEAIFEHEALLGELVLRGIRERSVDPIEWPGRGADRALYDWTPAPVASTAPRSIRRVSPLEERVWPELAVWLAERPRTAVVALGSTEQHGPHLPFGTDTWIATELARRFCERVAGAIALPTVPLGCASEHTGFPGTLSLEPATLESVLLDLVRSARRAGFGHFVVFSAHGGNDALLDSVAPRLRAAGAPMTVVLPAGLGPTTVLLHGLAARRGISAGAAGHHAGEVETSMMLELVPGSVRRERFAAGRLDVPDPASRLFYPDLRRNAPDGTVGDPCLATAAAGRTYLEAWLDALVRDYEAALAALSRARSRKKNQKTKGVQNE